MRTQHFILLAGILGFVSSSNDCHACIESVCYFKTPILSGYRFSGQLAVDRAQNILYFHYEDAQSIDYTAAFDLDDVRLQIIPNIDFSFARAVDQSSRDVYIGGARGIFKYNPTTNNTIQYGLPDKTVMHMQYKNKIYYTILESNGLYTFENKQAKSVAALSNYTIDEFIIDKHEDIYFLSQSNVYRLRKGANQVIVIGGDIYSLSIDKLGNARFVHSGKRGLYKMDSKTDEFIELGAFETGLPFKSVFDNNNNIIFHENSSTNLFILMPNYGHCMVSRSQGIVPKKHNEVMGRDENETHYELFIHRINRL